MKLQACYKGRLATLSRGLLSYIHQSFGPGCKNGKELDDAAGKCQGCGLAGFGSSWFDNQVTAGGPGSPRAELPPCKLRTIPVIGNGRAARSIRASERRLR